MDSRDVIELYEKGFSIDYIINEFYRSKKKDNYSFYNFDNRKVLICFNTVKKKECKGEVYKILYNHNKFLKDRPI